ncbi:MAG: AIR synthase-related protein, partial [Chitinophagales bacterium]
IGRNKNIIPGEVISAVIEATVDFLETMLDNGIEIHHSGGETADVGDIVRTIDVGITAFGRIEKKDLIVNNIQPGNIIVGLASYGRSTYENAYNGGMGSNGLTSARHDVFSNSYAEKYPESFNPAIPKEVVYTGTKLVTDKISIGNEDIDIGKLVLSPTRTYLPVIKNILPQFRKNISGIIHCSGGGQTKVLHFIDDVHIIKNNLFPVPPLFQLIQSESKTDWKEMYKVFNMGHRLEFYTDEKTAEEIIAISKQFNIDAQVIGFVEDGKKRLTIKSDPGEYDY